MIDPRKIIADFVNEVPYSETVQKQVSKEDLLAKALEKVRSGFSVKQNMLFLVQHYALDHKEAQDIALDAADIDGG